MNDPLDLKKYIRNVKDFPIEGIEFRDITSLIETPEAFVKTCKELTHVSLENLVLQQLQVLKVEGLFLQDQSPVT